MKIVVFLIAWLSFASSAWAFHEIESYSRSEQGGGAGAFFTGSPRFKGYNCRVCHTNTAGQISIALEVNRPELLQGQYELNIGYAITVKLVGEHRGLDSAFNPNTFMLEFVDDQGVSIGDYLPGPAPADLVDDRRIVAAEGFGEGETEWSFTWFSPRESAGPVTLYLAMLDGDGAGETDLRWIDPLNDDVATLELRLCPTGEPCPAPGGDVEIESKVHCNLAGSNLSAASALLWLFMAVLVLRPRRAGRYDLSALLLMLFACSPATRPGDTKTSAEPTKTDEASAEPMPKPAVLEFRVIRDGSDFMAKLCESVVADSKAGVMRIETGLDVWQGADGTTIRDCYLSAVDRTAMLNSQEAAAEDCRSRGDVERTACVISGRRILERYLAGRDDVELDAAHELAFELAESSAWPGESGDRYWRSYYLQREVLLRGDLLQQVEVQVSEHTAEPELLIAFNAEGARLLEKLTRDNLGHKLGILLDGRVISAPVIRSQITGGKVTLSLGPQVDTAGELAEKLRATIPEGR